MRRKKAKRKKLLRGVGWTLLGLVFSAFLFVIAASGFGWRFDVVSGGSMEPAFNQGGVVITQPADPKDIEVGDPILFREPYIEEEARICHRVIDIKEIDGEVCFETKGDANEYPDSDLVTPQNLVGKTIYYVPHIAKIGYLSRLHQAPIVFMGKELSVALLLIVAVGVILVGVESKNIWEWTFRTEWKRHKERLKKRNERLKRRH